MSTKRGRVRSKLDPKHHQCSFLKKNRTEVNHVATLGHAIIADAISQSVNECERKQRKPTGLNIKTHGRMEKRYPVASGCK